MTHITGDLHGEQYRLEALLKECEPQDVLLIAGDCGLLFHDNEAEHRFLDDISDYCVSRNIVLAYILGNHENYDAYQKLPVTQFFGGKVQQVRPNIIRLMNGEVYTIEGKTYFAFGGGYSIDKAMRLAYEASGKGKCWWSQELPGEQEYENGNRNLKKYHYKVDYVITHTVPLEVVTCLRQRYRQLSVIKSPEEEMPLQRYLGSVAFLTEFQKWYFGHFHVDCELGGFASCFGTRKLFRGLYYDVDRE